MLPFFTEMPLFMELEDTPVPLPPHVPPRNVAQEIRNPPRSMLTSSAEILMKCSFSDPPQDGVGGAVLLLGDLDLLEAEVGEGVVYLLGVARESIRWGSGGGGRGRVDVAPACGSWRSSLHTDDLPERVNDLD